MNKKVSIQAGDLVKKQPTGGVWIVFNANTNLGGWGPGSVELRSVKDPSYISYVPHRDIKKLIKVS
jgi:tRNA(Ser,Leu) C12 N-acetylase TAN1